MIINLYFKFKPVPHSGTLPEYELILASRNGSNNSKNRQTALKVIEPGTKTSPLIFEFSRTNKKAGRITFHTDFGLGYTVGTNELLLAKRSKKNSFIRIYSIKKVRQYSAILYQLFIAGYLKPFIKEIEASAKVQ